MLDGADDNYLPLRMVVQGGEQDNLKILNTVHIDWWVTLILLCNNNNNNVHLSFAHLHLNTHMIHINNMLFNTHVEHSATKTIYIKYYM